MCDTVDGPVEGDHAHTLSLSSLLRDDVIVTKGNGGAGKMADGRYRSQPSRRERGSEPSNCTP